MSALFVCKCLNVMLECVKYEDITDIEKLKLSFTEQRDIFFSEQLVSCEPSALKEHITQKALAGQRTVGRWELISCLSCSLDTHAVLQDRPEIVLICKSNLSSLDQVNNLKKSKNFSPVFNLLVPEVTNDFDMKENIDMSNVIVSDRKCPSPQQLISTLSTQMQQTLQTQLMAVEELVSQFKNQKYAEFEAYREKAHRDHKILTSIVNKARRNSDSEYWRMDSGLDNGPPSPLLPPLQRRRLSSIKDAKKFNQVSKPNRQLPPEEDSLDADDIFNWEDMDSQNNLISDNEDYDSDQGDSVDDGIQMPRRANCAELARSLPVTVPGLPQPRPARRAVRDNDEPSQDIAASIKALARSVTGDQFELPRPRFSTQI